MGLAEGNARLQLTVAAKVIARLDVLAKDAGMPKSQYVTMLVNEKWKEEGHSDLEDGFLCE